MERLTASLRRRGLNPQGFFDQPAEGVGNGFRFQTAQNGRSRERDLVRAAFVDGCCGTSSAPYFRSVFPIRIHGLVLNRRIPRRNAYGVTPRTSGSMNHRLRNLGPTIQGLTTRAPTVQGPRVPRGLVCPWGDGLDALNDPQTTEL
jgi:hypothetical protein